MTFEVRQFLEDGSWWTSYSSYYRYAHESLDAFNELLTRLRDEEERLRKVIEKDGFPSEHAEGYVLSETSKLHDEAHKIAVTCHLFSCMALEGFFNLYGARRLGEVFYQRNIERLGITEKLAVIGGCCNQWRLEDGSSVLKDLRALFDGRNRLVHPKAREFTPERALTNSYKHPREWTVSLEVDRMERCFDFILAHDSSLSRELLWLRPNSSSKPTPFRGAD